MIDHVGRAPTTEDGGRQPIAVPPIERDPKGHAANTVHEHLRSLILSGTLPPGAVLNQVELAPQLGVSRTPVREAIRMLQEEGLVDAQPQKRARVVEFDPEHLEAVYVQRILLEAFAARLTAARATPDLVASLESRLEEMRVARENQDEEEWRRLHRRFHQQLVEGVVGAQLARAIEGQMDRSERYRILYSVVRKPGEGDIEHEAIVDAYRSADGDLAAERLGSHLARTALSIIVVLAPAYDPAALRAVVEPRAATKR